MRQLVTAAVIVTACAAWSAAPAAAQQPTTTRASLTSTGAQVTDASVETQISADGRWVAFRSAAALVPPDTNGRLDVHLRDRLTGETRRISDGPGAAQGNGHSDQPVMTPDGRFVAFASQATNLVAGGTTGRQVFLFDRAAGTLKLGVVLPVGVTNPFEPSISADGSRIVVGTAQAAAGGDPARADIYVAETATGIARRITQTPAGVLANAGSFDPELSGDGRWASYTTSSTNLVAPDTNGFRDVIATDLQSGQHVRISATSAGGEPNLHSSSPSMSFDGCIVAFVSTASNLVASDDAVVQTKAFVRNRCVPETEILSLSNSGTQGAALSPDVSADGCVVAFLTRTILSPPPDAGTDGVAIRDRCAGVTTRADISSAGEGANGTAATPAVSATGRYVAFAHTSSNLILGDTNGVLDAYVRDRALNTRPEAALSLTQDARRVTADARASRDPDGPVVSGRIAFGDGTPETAGLQAVHDYARGGTYTVTATVTDSDGATTTRTLPVTVPDALAVPPPVAGQPLALPNGRPVTAASPPLVLDRAGLSRSRFAVVPRGGRPGGARGAQLTLRLSEPATLELRFERALAGRRVRGSCTTGARRGARCVRFVAAGTVRRSSTAGTKTILLTGVVGARALRRGRHRLRVVAVAADGRRSAVRTLSLTILPTRKA